MGGGTYLLDAVENLKTHIVLGPNNDNNSIPQS